MKSGSTAEDQLTYLTDLVSRMIAIDSKRPFGEDIALSGLLRNTPVLEAETTNPVSTTAKKEMDAYLVSQAEQADDPWLLFLESEYKGQVCFLNDIASRHKLYRVARISYTSTLIGKLLWNLFTYRAMAATTCMTTTPSLDLLA